MTKTRMGSNNAIDAKRYYTIKHTLKSPKDDKSAMDRFNIGATTARRIRRTHDYYEYRATSTTGRKERHRLKKAISELRSQMEENELSYEEVRESHSRLLVIFTLALLSGIVLAIMIFNMMLEVQK